MGGKHAPTTDAAPSSALPSAMNQGKGTKDDPYYSPKCRLRRSDPSADQLVQFLRGNQGLQRETTEMRLLRRAPLPGIGQSLTPRSNALNPINPVNSPITIPQQFHHDENEFNEFRFSKDDNLERVGVSSDESDSEYDLSHTYGTRMMRVPSPPRSTITLNPAGLNLSNSSHLVPKKQIKPQRKQKNTVYKLNAKNKRFESVQRRATADVRYLPPIRRDDIPDRPSAPRPNRTPPLIESDDDYYDATIAEEPIDYIDQD
ncbi:uncharacterized protein LOC135484130 [Lineus longissimus]|uniref:uncharacterized protein LOC135484130 n=1 Tax=Lineus longissimus TaxID=88925 RepID=UPI00315CB5C4